MENSTSVQIFAYKFNDEYVPERIIKDWKEEASGFEYADVAEGEYQAWEYPSGKIYDVRSDRVLGPAENQYATPYGTKGVVWQPVLVEIKIDVDLVNAAYSKMMNL